MDENGYPIEDKMSYIRRTIDDGIRHIKHLNELNVHGGVFSDFFTDK